MTKMAVGASRVAVRGYERDFDWTYQIPPTPPLVPLIPVVWDGLWLNTGDQADGLCAVVENIDGVIDSPPFDGNDVQRVISDGAAWGPKTLNARTIVISGAAAGPSDLLVRFRNELAIRAANREPALLAFGLIDAQRILTADVRAGTELLRTTPLSRHGFKYQVTLTAADPALHDGVWQTVTLTNVTEATGRSYPRRYPWQYAGMIPNSALLRNEGNFPAPVYAGYEGELSTSLLTDGTSGIRVAYLEPGVQILVSTATLAAEAPGGYSRASYIQPGSRPMWIAPRSSPRWTLRSAGRGSVTLAWRSTWV
jgi:hypothetical protein